jgi:cytochrome c-type biogenesis protein CcmH/NrfG
MSERKDGFDDRLDNEPDSRLSEAVDAILAEPSPQDVRRRLIDAAASWTPASVAGRPRRRVHALVVVTVAASLLLAASVGLYFATGMGRTREVAVNQEPKTDGAHQSATDTPTDSQVSTRRGLCQASLGKEDDEHDVSLKPFIGTLRVESPSRRV